MANDLVPEGEGEGVEAESMVPTPRIGIWRPGGGASALVQGEENPGPDIPIVRMPAGGPVRLGRGNALVTPKAKPAAPKAPAKARIADPDMERYLSEEAAKVPLRNAPPEGAPDEPVEPPAGPRLVDLPAHEYAHTYSPLLHTEGPPRKPRSRSVSEIAKDLHDRAQEGLKGMGIESGRITPKNATEDNKEMLARMIAHEVSQNSIRTGKAGDWYTDGVDDAISIAHMMHPEMGASDPETGERTPKAKSLDTAFKLGLAITSQGEAVNNQTKLTNDKVFEHFKQTGRFPTDVEHQKGIPVNGNFAKANDIIDRKGMDGLIEFLHTPFKVSDLEKITGKKVSGFAKDDEVYGSAIFGPKIGNGFYQNLAGNYTPMAYDLWWTRGWNRLTGNLHGQQDPAAFEKTKQVYRDSLKAEGKRAPANDDQLLDMALADHQQHEALYRKYAKEFKSGDRTKSDRTLAAARYVEAKQGVNQMPKSPGERRLMKDVAQRAVRILKEHGIDVTNADMQALWWYPEKDLYERMGGRGVEDLNVDYAGAMKDLALEKGFTQKQIDDVLAAAKAKRSGGK
jgi:hypothetical protein